MNKDLKIIIVGLLSSILLVISFLLFFNDIINYSIICFVITLLLIANIIYTIVTEKNDKVSYENRLKNVLKSYDSDIIYAETDYEIKEKNVLFVKSLEDILVASSIIGSPIVYIDEGDASTFLVKNDEDLLAYVLKSNNKQTTYEKKLKDIIKQNEKNVNSLLNSITEETIIIIDNKSYKVSPVNK